MPGPMYACGTMQMCIPSDSTAVFFFPIHLVITLLALPVKYVSLSVIVLGLIVGLYADRSARVGDRYVCYGREEVGHGREEVGHGREEVGRGREEVGLAERTYTVGLAERRYAVAEKG